ncbi:MAG TPA: MarR family transcriptional regulator [Micromonosporaceae bacterium]|nr:MarR family transcriptional regulator [Micromonosporaceae bacterium]
MPTPKPTSPTPTTGEDEVMDALLSASRAMVALAARSLAGLDSDVTLPQYRALVVLASRGPQRVIDISTELGVTASTGTRMCDRLVRKRLIRRYRTPADRREVRLTLTPSGRALVKDVTLRRRGELTSVVQQIPVAWRKPVTAALRAVAAAVGELPERDWWLDSQRDTYAATDEP